jgi:hypothetical protein
LDDLDDDIFGIAIELSRENVVLDLSVCKTTNFFSKQRCHFMYHTGTLYYGTSNDCYLSDEDTEGTNTPAPVPRATTSTIVLAESTLLLVLDSTEHFVLCWFLVTLLLHYGTLVVE